MAKIHKTEYVTIETDKLFCYLSELFSLRTRFADVRAYVMSNKYSVDEQLDALLGIDRKEVKE